MGGSSVAARADEGTKRRASRSAEDFGFDPSPVARTFKCRMIRGNVIPLRLGHPVPDEDSREARAEWEWH